MSDRDKREVKAGRVTRRDFLKYASASAGITAATLALGRAAQSSLASGNPMAAEPSHGHPVWASSESQVPGGMNPMQFLKSYYMPDKDPVTGERMYELTAAPQSIEVARGVSFPAWTFYGPAPYGPTAPGPTLRCSEGDSVVIRLHNGDSHPHTVHLHGIHRGDADGVFEILGPGDNYDYRFTAEPFGLFLYHCHVMPVKKHISKGLYGAFIIEPITDPITGLPMARPTADHELTMVMNGFDVDFDDENEFYTVNGIANYFYDHPIRVGVGQLVRIYLVNMTEFDPVNSFHLHGNMFRLYRTGTRFDPKAVLDPNTSRPLEDRIREWLYLDDFAEVTDTVFLGQGERAIIEFIARPKHQGGKFLFHAHQSEFIELGWTGIFEII